MDAALTERLADFFVDPGETTPVWVSLSEAPRRWYQEWWVWTTVGVVVVGATTAAILVGSADTPPPEGDIMPGQIGVSASGGLTHR